MDYDMGEVVMSGVNSYDPGRGRLVTEIEPRTPDGRVERGAVAHHVFTAAEIVRMVESSKFRVSELLGDPAERSAFEVGSRRLILLATAV